VAPYTAARLDGEADHLMRVGAWGGASLVGGLIAATLSDSDAASAYGLQSVAWGAINLGIAGTVLSRRAPPAEVTYEAERAAERRLQRLLGINLALNSGYILVGGATALSAPEGTRGARQRGHGSAIVVQGAALMLLDAVAYHDSRRRSATLQHVRLTASPSGAHLSIRL